MRGAEYAELAAFVAVAQARHFRRAAAELGLSPSALSHTIRKLEARLGVRLLNRTTRSVSPTEAGYGLFDRVSPAFADIDGAVEQAGASRERLAGRVRINLPKMAADCVVAPVLSAFARAYPGIHLELAVDDALTDIVAGGFDAGIRPGHLVHQDMIAVRVSPALPMAVVGSPEYLASRPRPKSPDGLTDHACINYRWYASRAVHLWQFQHDGELIDVDTRGPLTLNDNDLMVTAALDGLGLIHMPKFRVAEHLAAGRLELVLEKWCRSLPGFFIYYPGRRWLSPALRALVDFLKV